MSKKRDHKRYTLWDSHTLVYVGITDDPGRRETEHPAEGKSFTRMQIEGPAVSKESALKWEQERRETYRRHHRGRDPKYNKQ